MTVGRTRQATAKYEGSQDQHLRCAFSEDAREWSLKACDLPLNHPGELEAVRMPSGRTKQWRKALWSPVLHYDEDRQEVRRPPDQAR